MVGVSLRVIIKGGGREACSRGTRFEDNFNLNKWSRGRHLCPRLVLFMPDYSERTCAAVSSGALPRVVSMFPSTRQGIRRRTCPPYSPSLSSPRRLPCPLFALIYAIATRDASSAH